jgi:TonB-dependent Receptor Plug Domain
MLRSGHEPPWPVAALAAAVLLLGAANAAADPAPSAPAPSGGLAPGAQAIVPPKLRSSPDVGYPDGAGGEASVILIITVNADGSVRAARVEIGDEPFASLASRAALGWRFDPATRDGAPIAAVVRAQLVFRPPPPPSDVPVVPPSAEAPDVGPAAVPAAPVEVTIRGVRPLAPAVSSFDRSEVRQLPGAFGDPFRAIEALPGVTPIASGVPFFYVRGAPPGNVGYFLDGVRVPLLYHLGAGPSVIHPAIVDRVDLYPGGYPAEFGRFAGGIVAAETTLPASKPRGEGSVRLLDAGALVEAPFAEGRATALVGGRYSYTAALLSLVAPDTSLAYWDYQTRFSYRTSPKGRATAFIFGSFDGLGQRENGQMKTLFSTQFHRADLRYDHELGDGKSMRLAVTLGFDRTAFADDAFLRDQTLGTRFETTYRLTPELTLRAGFDAVVDRYDVEARTSSGRDPGNPQPGDTSMGSNDDIRQVTPARSDFATGVRADVVVKLAPDIELVPGIRVDAFVSGNEAVPSVDPRVAARIGITDRLRTVHTFGVAHQPPSFIVPWPGFRLSGLESGLQRSLQWSSGVEGDLTEGTTATFTVFQNIFFNMTDPLGTLAVVSNSGVEELTQRSFGSAVGAELLVRRRLTRRVGGFLSYTLSRSQRKVGDHHFPSGFDRTHVLNAAVAFDLGRSWRAGMRGVLYTGTPRASTLPIPGENDPNAYVVVVDSYPERMPAFYRLDVRLEKRWTFGETTWLSFVFEMLNATLHKETFGYNCSSTGCRTEEIGPVTFPSIGVEAGF